MANFKEADSTEEIKDNYFTRVIVFLESDEDLDFIAERWFQDEKEFIHFRSAGGKCGDGISGGCTVVVNKVNALRKANRVAFGLVDRDSLLREMIWDYWWSPDNNFIQNCRKLGDYIRVLPRWEIENYLLDLTAINKILNDRRIPTITDERLIEYEEFFKHLTSVQVLLHKDGIGIKQSPEKCPSLVNLEGYFNGRRRDEQSTSVHCPFNLHLAETEIFAEDEIDAHDRWRKVSRIFDGKRFLRKLDLSADEPKNDWRFTLARHVSAEWLLEFKPYFEEFKAALPLF